MRIKSIKEIQIKLETIIGQESEEVSVCPTKVEQIKVTDITKKFSTVEIKLPDLEFNYPNKYLITYYT